MAEIRQSFTVAHPRDAVWTVFQDLPRVVACVPGASLTEPPVDGAAKGRMTVKIGPIKADFGGEATVESNAADFTGTITGNGVDRNQNSRAKGTVRYTLESVGEAETRVDVTADYTLSGPLAQVARGGIVDAVAAQIVAEFTANLEAELSAAEPAADEPSPADTGTATEPGTAELSVRRPAEATPARPDPRDRTPPPTARPGAGELNLLAILRAVIRQKLRNLFRRGGQ